MPESTRNRVLIQKKQDPDPNPHLSECLDPDTHRMINECRSQAQLRVEELFTVYLCEHHGNEDFVETRKYNNKYRPPQFK
jgi:hypothetical protein